MAQCWACAVQRVGGLQGGGMMSASSTLCHEERLGGKSEGGGARRRAWRVTCGADFNQFKVPNKSNEEDVNKKRAPVRLPGGRQVPVYGNSVQKSPPGLGQFKPPQLYGAPVQDDAEDVTSRADAIIAQIREGLGSWQERATGITELQRMGMGMEEIYETAYVASPTQTSMVVAAQVYKSMVQVGCSSEVLGWFDETKVEVLYALRTLSAQQRKLAAEYTSGNELEVDGAQELARAIKDHERRPQGREGFTAVPGDCLAFSLHRAAGETTNAEERSLLVERGLSLAVSDSAKQRFSEYL